MDGLMDEGGVWRTGVENTLEVVERYFTNLFSTSHSNTIDEVLVSVDAVITEDMNRNLLLPFVGEEVSKALFQIHPSNSPGPDDMSPFFFQKYWHIMGREMSLKLSYLF